MKTIKAVYTNNFEIIFSEVETFPFQIDYIIQYKRTEDELYKTSEYIKDFKTADHMFHSKLAELEGH